MSSSGPDAVAFAGRAQIQLLDWQEAVLLGAMAERADLRWAAFIVGLCAPRQNGKNEILIARQLYGLFCIPWEKLLIHCAHLGDTSREAFRRLVAVIDAPGNGWLKQRVKRIARSRGDEGIELFDGSRILFKSRNSGGSGRGFTGDVTFLDEAMDITEDTMGDLEPTMVTRDFAQMWLTGSAPDQVAMPNSVVFAKVRARGHAKTDAHVMWVEFKADGDHPDEVTPAMVRDPAVWGQANPSLGRLIPLENLERMAGGSRRKFAIEILNVGDWPSVDEYADAFVDPDVWDGLEDHQSKPLDPVCFAFDVAPNRKSASIGVAGYRADGRLHVEVVERFRSTDGIVDRLVALVEKHDAEVRCDGKSAAASLVPELVERGILVEEASMEEHGEACGMFADAVDRGDIVHLGTGDLADAVRAAVKRPLSAGETFGLSRKNSGADITPLVSVIVAAWGVSTTTPSLDPGLYAQVF